MAEDTLMLNMTLTPAVHKHKKRHTPFRTSDKWKMRKAEKRKALQGTQKSPPFKKTCITPEKKPAHTDQQPPHQGQTPPKKRNFKSLPQNQEGVEKCSPKLPKPPKVSQKSHPDGQQKEDRELIKTSSLFKNNPEIPEMQRPTVTQLREKVFTSCSFVDLDLHPHLVSTLNNVLKVTSMTSVQKQTIPVLLAGQDAVVRSQTGSGKTLAYGIPLVQSLQAVQPKIKCFPDPSTRHAGQIQIFVLSQFPEHLTQAIGALNSLQREDGPFAVVVVPTRELAQQSFQIIQKLLKPFTWIVPGVLMGGEKRKSEKARLRKGINILIATPGRLVDHINNTLSIAFSAVRWLILDEADRTLDLGFEKDLAVILNALNASGPPRQNVLLSATLTEGVTRLVGISLKDPVSIHACEAPEQRGAEASTMLPDSFAVPEKLQQHVVLVPSKLRLVCLAAFILAKCRFEGAHKMVVFLSSCEAVGFLLRLFTTVLAEREEPSASPEEEEEEARPLRFLQLHGGMAQEERTEVFQDFSGSTSGILLCTDVAARGLDLPHVTWIVQYDPPASPAEYVHRVGRTARIGARGSSLLFLTPSEAAYVSALAEHNISMSEMKMEDILAGLMLDERFKGRGKWGNKKSAGALQQEVRVRATVLQTEFENTVHSTKACVQEAKKALQSFLRAYATYPASLKHIFHIRRLHLGHAAKSFGLRDAPQGLGAVAGARSKAGKRDDHGRKRPPRKPNRKERVASLLCSEYASGLDSRSTPRKKKPQQMD